MKIDWDKLRSLLPIYSYEYESAEAAQSSNHLCNYWYPHWAANKGKEPPPGWIEIGYDESYETLMKALSEYCKLQPGEKAVWYDSNTGTFSNSWPFENTDMMRDAIEHAKTKSGWQLIVYRVPTSETFEFCEMMKIVSSTKEDRERK